MKFTITLFLALFLLFTIINAKTGSMFSNKSSTARMAMKAKTKSVWQWKTRNGFIRDASMNTYSEYVAIAGNSILWGIDTYRNRWRQYPGGKRGVLAAAFSNENVVWICRGNVIEKFIPKFSHKFYGRWVRVPGCCRDIDIGANGFVAVIGCDNHTWGYGIWRNLGGDGRRWARIPGEADRIAVGSRGQIVVKNRGKRFFWKYSWNANWIMTGGAGNDVALTNDGKMVVIGTDYHVYHSTTVGPNVHWVKNNGMGTAISARHIGKNGLIVAGMDRKPWWS